MKHLLSLVIFCGIIHITNAQSSSKVGKLFIFDSYGSIQKCTKDGLVDTDDTNKYYAPKGARFNVENISAAGNYIIKFRDWKLTTAEGASYYALFNMTNAAKRKLINPAPNNALTNTISALNEQVIKKLITKNNDNSGKEKSVQQIKDPNDEQYFILTTQDFEAHCSEFQTKLDFTYGVLTTPFKLRNHPAIFTTDFSVGTCVLLQKRVYKNFNEGFVFGLSLSSVTLDSFSTKGYVVTATERPALTPSFHAVIGWNAVNLTVGIGWDHINKRSDVEKSWLYNGRRWFGIGIGLSLFKKNEKSVTRQIDGQK